MNNIKILIVENEILIAQHISGYLEKLNYVISGIARTGEDALKIVEEHSPDIVLMDIELDGELDGIDTAALIQKRNIVPIIYLTKFDDSRILKRVKKNMPAAYLIKPFKNSDVRNAIEIAINNIGKQSNTKVNKETSFEKSFDNHQAKNDLKLDTLNNRIFYKKSTRQYNRLFISDIVYLEADNTTTIAHTITGHYNLPLNLKNTLLKLDGTSILRIHRQYAVNIDYISQVNGNEVTLEYIIPQKNKHDMISVDEKQIKILTSSNSYRKELFNLLNIK